MDTEPNHRLEAVMKSAGCSNKGLARRVADVADRHGVHVGYSHVNVRRWLEGTHPRGLTPNFIAEALAQKLGRPVTLADIGMHSSDDPLRNTGRYPDTARDAVAALEELVRVDLAAGLPAGLHTIDTTSWSDAMVQWLIAPDMRSGPAHLGDPSTTVEAMRCATTMFSQLDYRFGGGYARSALTQYVKTEVLPLLGDDPNTQPPEVLSAAAALLRLTGWTAYDTGHHQLAHNYLLHALRLAKTAGDRALGGRILAGMSHQANFLGHHDQAANLARAAAHGAAGKATPTAMALFHSMEARALAMRGDRRDCEHALLQAEQWLGKRVVDDDPEWLRYFDDAELAAEFAHSYRDLGMSDMAVKFAETAISLHAPVYARSIAFCRAVMAAGHLGAGEIDQGIALADDVVAVIAALRSGRCNAYIRDFVGRLEPYRSHRPVTEFITRTEALIGAPA